MSKHLVQQQSLGLLIFNLTGVFTENILSNEGHNGYSMERTSNFNKVIDYKMINVLKKRKSKL